MASICQCQLRSQYTRPAQYNITHYPRYRNGQEFYRHIPTDRPQTVVFRQAGLIVDVSILMSLYNSTLTSEL